MKDLKTNLLRYNQREQIQGEISQAEDMLKTAKNDDAGIIRSNMNKAKRMLETGSPEPLTANPVGAVDHSTRWEKANKPLIRMWKNVRIQLNPDNADRDLANVERLRPSGQMDRMRTDAQIPGMMSYGNIPDELWPFMPPTNTALEQVKRTYETSQAEDAVAETIAQTDKNEVETDSAVMTEEEEALSLEKHAQRIQILEKARAALKKKREEDKQLQESLDAVPVMATA